MIDGMEDGDERIDRLLEELAAYGVIDAGAESGTEIESADGVDVERGESDVVPPLSGTRGDSGAPVAAESAFAHLGTQFPFEEAIIKENLEAILLGLISVRRGAHGKRLINDLSDFFDAQLSPGTVYPRLHDLEAAGVLRVHELVRTKEYTIADETRARRRIERAMGQHFALGAVFRSSLEHGPMASDRG
jgi:DNA-binding PadR family transcriptional regulator